jgi:hypothetical protein
MRKQKSLEIKLIRMYEQLIRLITANFNLKTTAGEQMTKLEMERKYLQTTLLELVAEGNSILCLIKNNLNKQATLHNRKILEIYLQARLLKYMNSEKAYKSFWLFMDYSKVKQIEYMLDTANSIKNFDFEETSKILILDRIRAFEALKTKEKYMEALREFKEEFRNKFPAISTNNLPNNKHTYWIGYSPLQIAKLFPDGALEIYLELYGDISNNVHPNPISTVEHIPMEGHKRRWGSDALIHGINLTIWTVELFVTDNIMGKKLNKLSDNLNTTLLDHRQKDEE